MEQKGETAGGSAQFSDCRSVSPPSPSRATTFTIHCYMRCSLNVSSREVLLHGRLTHLKQSQYTHPQKSFTHNKQRNLLPAQHPQNEIEDEKGAEDDERDKIDPRQLIAHSILHLRDGREGGGRQGERWWGQRSRVEGGEGRGGGEVSVMEAVGDRGGVRERNMKRAVHVNTKSSRKT